MLPPSVSEEHDTSCGSCEWIKIFKPDFKIKNP